MRDSYAVDFRYGLVLIVDEGQLFVCYEAFDEECGVVAFICMAVSILFVLVHALISGGSLTNAWW